MRKTVWRKRDRGSAMVEFAFSALFMLVATITLMEVCNAVYTYVVLSEAANEGVRYAIVRSTDGNLTSDVKAQVGAYAAGGAGYEIAGATNSAGTFQSSDVTVSCPDTGGCAVYNTVKVQIRYPYVDLFGIFTAMGATNPTMSAYAEGRFVY